MADGFDYDEWAYQQIKARLVKEFKLEPRIQAAADVKQRQTRLDILSGKHMPPLDYVETD